MRFAWIGLAVVSASACASDASSTAGSTASGGSAGAEGGSGGQTIGQGGSPADTGTDAPACQLQKPYSSQDAACNACAEAECCALINVCYSDPDCDDGYVNCILACALLPGDAGDAGVESCIADCAAQHPAGRDEYDAAIGCADAKCAGSCS
ncbi:MAG: hypothetical protein HS104_01730 [Polyangiaceae bacterium]|nr:hypothetical protein [Polyangiaceae bacterium]MCL4755199.1 hypothetical protein [Myxococcales bacterium]